MENNQSTKSQFEAALKDMLAEINEKFAQSAAMVDGLGKWSSDNMKRLEVELKRQAVSLKVMDFAVSSLVQLLEEKKILDVGEYKEKANKMARDSQLEVK
jgi:hypothetical protein